MKKKKTNKFIIKQPKSTSCSGCIFAASLSCKLGHTLVNHRDKVSTWNNLYGGQRREGTEPCPDKKIYQYITPLKNLLAVLIIEDSLVTKVIMPEDEEYESAIVSYSWSQKERRRWLCLASKPPPVGAKVIFSYDENNQVTPKAIVKWVAESHNYGGGKPARTVKINIILEECGLNRNEYFSNLISKHKQTEIKLKKMRNKKK